MSQDKAEFELEDMKKKYKDLKFEGKAYKDRLDKLRNALIKHMDQYVDLRKYFFN